MRGGRLSHRWSPAVRRIIRLRTMTVKTAPCLLPPPAHGRLASGSQRTVKCCGDWLKIHHQPKFCGSSRAGWSQWWKRRSHERGGGEEVGQEVVALQKRQRRRTAVLDLLTSQTKRTHRRAQTAKLKRLLPNPLWTKTLPQVRLCTLSLSEAILHIPLLICLLTCQC